MRAAETLPVHTMTQADLESVREGELRARLLDVFESFRQLVAAPVLEAGRITEARKALRDRLELAHRLRYQLLQALVASQGADALRKVARVGATTDTTSEGSPLERAVTLAMRTSALATWRLPAMLTPPSSLVQRLAIEATHAASTVETLIWICVLGDVGDVAIRSRRVFTKLCADALTAAEHHAVAVAALVDAADQERRVVLLLDDLRRASSPARIDGIQDQLFHLAARFVAELTRIASDPAEPPLFRAALLTMLAGVDPRGSRAGLLASADDIDPRVRIAALEGLAELLPDDEVRAVLRSHADGDGNDAIRRAASEAIGPT